MIDILNNNAGVITAVQTLATVFLSVVAIVVTIIYSRMPYKKKLIIYSGLDIDDQNNCRLHLCLYNSGNVSLYIKDIQVQKEYKNGDIDCLEYTSWKEEKEKCILIPKMMNSFSLEEFNCTEEDKQETNMLIVIFTEEKIFRKRIDWAVG